MYPVCTLFSPDTALVGTRVSEVGDDRLTMEYRVVSKARDELVADGTAIVVSYDYTAGRKTPLPAAVRKAIATIEKGTIADSRLTT